VAQILVNGVSVGALYALLALSFWVIFAVTRTFHLAHVIVLTYAAYTLYWVLGPASLPLWLAVPAAGGVAVALGVAIEAWVYQPIRRRGGSQLILFVASSALLIIGQAVLALVFEEYGHGIEQDVPPPVLQTAQAVVTRYDVLNVLFAVTASVVVWALLRHHRWGHALRAVQGNAELAGYFGLDVARIFRISFGLGSLLLLPPVVVMALRTGVHPELGFTPVLVAIVAVITGGTESQAGAMLAGFLLGCLENVALLWVGAHWQPMITFLVLFVVLLWRPRGLRAAVEVRTTPTH